jgi:hypothetical protein
MLYRIIKAVRARLFATKQKLSPPLDKANQRNDDGGPSTSGRGDPHGRVLAAETRGGPGGGNGNIGHAMLSKAAHRAE